MTHRWSVHRRQDAPAERAQPLHLLLIFRSLRSLRVLFHSHEPPVVFVIDQKGGCGNFEHEGSFGLAEHHNSTMNQQGERSFTKVFRKAKSFAPEPGDPSHLRQVMTVNDGDKQLGLPSSH